MKGKKRGSRETGGEGQDVAELKDCRRITAPTDSPKSGCGGDLGVGFRGRAVVVESQKLGSRGSHLALA